MEVSGGGSKQINVIQRQGTIGSIILMRFRRLMRWTALAASVVLLVLGVLLTGVIGSGCFILGLLLLGIAVWSFLRRQASLGRTLSSVRLAGGLLCLAPGLWFLWFFSRLNPDSAPDLELSDLAGCCRHRNRRGHPCLAART